MSGSIKLPVFGEDDVYTPEQLAHRLGIAVQTLWRWRREKSGPCAYRIGLRLYYKESDVNAWLEGNKII